MKKTINVFFAMALATVVLMSCAGNKSKDLIAKKWQFSEFLSEEMNEQQAKMLAMADTTKDSTMKSQIVEQIKMYDAIKDEMKKSSVEYKNDGNLEANIYAMGQSRNMKAKWAITENGKSIIVTDEQQKVDTSNIDELTSEKFVMSTVKNGKKETIVLVPVQ